MATGYDVGLSASTALSNATPQTTDAGTVFNFSSPGASGDFYSQDQTADPSAVAVSTNKSPGASTDVATPDDGSIIPATTGNGLTTSSLVIIGAIVGGLGLIALVIYLKK